MSVCARAWVRVGAACVHVGMRVGACGCCVRACGYSCACVRACVCVWVCLWLGTTGTYRSVGVLVCFVSRCVLLLWFSWYNYHGTHVHVYYMCTREYHGGLSGACVLLLWLSCFKKKLTTANALRTNSSLCVVRHDRTAVKRPADVRLDGTTSSGLGSIA